MLGIMDGENSRRTNTSKYYIDGRIESQYEEPMHSEHVSMSRGTVGLGVVQGDSCS